jgi:hypothetical protein
VDQKDRESINWADVAARARADLGDEKVASFSERLRTTMTLAVVPVRLGDGWGNRFRELPPTEA